MSNANENPKSKIDHSRQRPFVGEDGVEFRLPLSLAIITLNEADNIERCIRSVPFASEIVVVDSGSSDDTVKIAESLGARVVFEPWKGFRAQKQFATQLCTNDWVLSLDADEALSMEAAEEVLSLFGGAGSHRSEQISILSDCDGFEFPRLSWNLGRWIKHGGWYPDLQLRLYHRMKASWQGGEHVHERVSAGKVLRLKGPLLHWPFSTHAEQVATNNRYSGLGAQDLLHRGKKFRLYKLILKPLTKFIETYLIKRGFLDGLPGFIISVGAAYSVFLKFVKLWELQKASKKNP